MNLLSYIKPAFSSILHPDWTVTKDVQYYSGSEHKLDLYLLNNGKKNPTIVFIHGGGWQTGDKFVYEGRAKKYALAGFNVAAINYTLATEDPATHWPAQLRDCLQALHYLKINADLFGIDKTRLAVGGDSAGAHLSLFLNEAKVILNMFGPCDLTQPDLNQLLDDLWVFDHKTYEQDPTLYKNASPLFGMSKVITPPIVTVHGRNDEVVPYNQALMLKAKLDALGVQNELIPYNGGHEFSKLPWWEELIVELKALWFVLRHI